jgi:phosphoesterase RecJ-like protein
LRRAKIPGLRRVDARAHVRIFTSTIKEETPGASIAGCRAAVISRGVYPCVAAARGKNPRPAPRFHPMSEISDTPVTATIDQIGEVLRSRQSFVLISHVRPDGDAIGSQLALGYSLKAMGKSVRLINEDGLPENLAFLSGSEIIETPPAEPLDVEVAIALDTATKPRLGDAALHAASKAKLWLNIDHHISNPKYGDLNLIDSTSPATGEILYDLITALDLPLPPETRDAIYVAVSTDTGSFQYPSTTARTYEMAADLVRRGLDVGTINSKTYDEHPYRRLELMRALLNTLERSPDGVVAHWELREKTRLDLALRPEDSEGLIDVIRAIRGVRLAAFFEELPDGKVRVSMRSKDRELDVCKIASAFGGGGHALAAGIRMKGPLEAAKQQVLAAIHRRIEEAKSEA